MNKSATSEKILKFGSFEIEIIPCNNGRRSDVVGNTFSLADNETKNANGTSQRHMVKYAITSENG